MALAGSGTRDIMQPLFPTFLGVFQYPDHAAEKQRLLDGIARVREKDEAGRQRSEQEYHAGYSSFFGMQDLQLVPAFSNLAAFIRDKAHAYANFHKFDLARFDLLMSNFWINVNPRHSYHPEHIHPYSHLSGVYYVSSDAQMGDIVFRDPRAVRLMAPLPVTQSSNENTDVFRLAPEEGRLLIFPAWLSHGVDQNRTDGERVSMSFNFDLRPRAAR